MPERSAGSSSTQVVTLPGPVQLELGGWIESVRIAYRTWGALAPGRDNAVVVSHALTGSADVEAWWPGLLGPGRALDPDRDFVICSNVLGSCYGTTGPTSPEPGTNRPYGPRFPRITVRDMVRVQACLVRALGVQRVALVIGGSLGGMQALEWAAMFPGMVEALVPIATSARHSAWCIGLSESQRQAIYADPRWRGGDYPPDDPPRAGLAAARMMAMCTYRSHASFEDRFSRERALDLAAGNFAVESYLRHQGEKLVERFDANTYVALTLAMDTHDVGRDRGGREAALARLCQPALVVSIPTDVLYPPSEQAELEQLMPGATLERLDSRHGHDGFLIDIEALDELILAFRACLATRRREQPLEVLQP